MNNFFRPIYDDNLALKALKLSISEYTLNFQNNTSTGAGFFSPSQNQENNSSPEIQNEFLKKK
ncbi:hypothetical protein N9L02_00810 [Gammaproteobacteria bacterium]|nr:hypothetical protein [Gammaproteobacteria bacterium]